MKVASSNIVTYPPIKRDAAQYKAKDLSLRGSTNVATLEAITGKTQRHYFSLILDISTDLGGHTIKGKINCSHLRDPMLQVGLQDTKYVQYRQILEN